MRLLLPFMLTMLAACAQQTTPSAAPPRGGTCDAGPVQFAVGYAWTDRLAEEVRQRSGARVLRVLSAGDAATMEFSPERLTVQLDEGRRVATARCG